MTDNNQIWAASTPGARHDARLARQAVFANTGGVTGLVAGSEPRVSLTPGVPMSVRLHPCSVVAASTYAGARRESYSFDVPEPVDVAVDTTGSVARTDVIAFAVADPILEGKDVMELDVNGEPVPESTGIDPRDFDYWSAVRFPSVPSSARRSPEAFRQWAQGRQNIHGPIIPYAIVTQGANSVGLEGKVKPFFETVMGRKDSILVETRPSRLYRESEAFSAYRTIGPTLYYDVPWWATRARLKATIQGVSLYSDTAGNRSGLVSGLSLGRSMRQYRYYESGESKWARQTFHVWADIAIRENQKGTTQDFRLRMTAAQSTAEIRVSEDTYYFLEVEFLEDPNAVDNSDPEDA